jgi:DNA (cytosine-5)-methyltransferase 1
MPKTTHTYYNENAAYPAQWLRNLIAQGLLPDGVVDERSIAEVSPSDVKGFTRCHFFAGIGGWELALQLANWPTDQAVWTGSCPCQPFSAAGRQGGRTDPRHLWPQWFRLIRKCKPPTILGEQVDAAVAHGWLDEVAVDLEAQAYAIGAAILPASAAGAFQRRSRLWFVARAECGRRPAWSSEAGSGSPPLPRNSGSAGAVGGAKSARLEGCEPDEPGAPGWEVAAGSARPSDSSLQWVQCADNRFRPVKPGLRLLAHGVPQRVGRISAYGNAIVPQIAAIFIRACLEANL